MKTIPTPRPPADAESGLDDFDARYYSSNLGRFISADWSAIPEPVPCADFTDPQSLNLYTYVRNLPTVNVDPNGHDILYDSSLKNAADVKAVVSALLANPATSSQLSGYVGKDNPDLTIKSGDLNPNGPLVTHNDDGTTTTTRVDGNTSPDIQTATINGGPPETQLNSATITVDNGVSGIDKLAEVMSHESDHAKQARTDPAGYKNERAQNMKDFPNPQDHDKRSQEQRANAFAKAHAKDIAKQAKAIKKAQKKKDNQS